MLDDSRIRVTAFGGGSKWGSEMTNSDIPKLTDTTVLEFGEKNKLMPYYITLGLQVASFPGLRPDFISQPWRKIPVLCGGLGMRLGYKFIVLL